jgi:hypothetical protein
MLSSAFSGILGYLFSLLNGHGVQAAYWLGQHFGPTKKAPLTPVSYGPGLSGWRWIFILQGVITVLIGIVGWYFIVDFPELAAKPSKTQKKFLNQDEVDFIVARIEEDRHDVVAEEFNLKSYLAGAMDLKVWGFALIFMFTTTITYAIAYFLPIILKDGMGFSPAASNCLIAPPYVFAGFVMIGFAWAGDKYHIRSPWVIANGVLALIGLPMIGFSTNVGVRYFGKSTLFSHPSWTHPLTSLLRCIPRHRRCKRKRSMHPHLASQQHPWTMEARSLQRYSRWRRRYWRYHRWHCLQDSRRTVLCTRYHCMHDCCRYDHRHLALAELEVLDGEQEGCEWRQDYRGA